MNSTKREGVPLTKAQAGAIGGSKPKRRSKRFMASVKANLARARSKRWEKSKKGDAE